SLHHRDLLPLRLCAVCALRLQSAFLHLQGRYVKMAPTVSRYRLAWDPVARRGEVAFLAGGSTPIRIPVGSADEFNALALMLKEPVVVWDGRVLWSDSSSARTLGEGGEAGLLDLLEIKP